MLDDSPITTLSKVIQWLDDIFDQVDECQVIAFDHRDVAGMNRELGFDNADKLMAVSSEIIRQELACHWDVDFKRLPSGQAFAVIKGCPSKFTERVSDVMQRLKAPLEYHTTGFGATTRAIAEYPSDGDNAQLLVLKLEEKIKEYKRRSATFETASLATAPSFVTRQRLQKAIELQEFEVYFQAIHGVSENRVIALEALARWNHPEHGVLSPLYFIERLTRFELIYDFGNQIFEKAIKQLAAWRRNGARPDLSMSINVSVLQLRNPAFFRFIKSRIEHYEVPPECVQIEVTEENVQCDISTRQLRSITDFGIKLAIDDFGTGVSNFRRIVDIQVDSVKIDKSFLKDINNPRSKDIFTPLVSLCKAMSPRTVVEGVETEEQRAFVESVGANAIQGFFYSRPAPAAEITIDTLK